MEKHSILLQPINFMFGVENISAIDENNVEVCKSVQLNNLVLHGEFYAVYPS